MIQGTTPTIAFAFPIEIESLKEFDLTIEQEGKADLTKTRDNFEIDTEKNVAYTKLSQEETREFDPRKYVKMQINAVTLDDNVIASQIITDHICPNIKKTNFELETTEITPIDITTFKLDFSQNTCGFNIGFGDMIVYEERPADKQLSSTSTNAVQNKIITDNFDRVDIELIKQKQAIENAEEIARGKPNSKSFDTYRDMVNYLNSAPNTIFKINDDILIATLGIPDFWVFSVEPTSVPYTYVDDQTLADQISSEIVQIGYYKLSQLEGVNKQTFEKYALKSQVPNPTTHLKENGAYTLIITTGIE